MFKSAETLFESVETIFCKHLWSVDLVCGTGLLWVESAHNDACGLISTLPLSHSRMSPQGERRDVEWGGAEQSGVEWSRVEWSGVEWSRAEWSGAERNGT